MGDNTHEQLEAAWDLASYRPQTSAGSALRSRRSSRSSPLPRQFNIDVMTADGKIDAGKLAGLEQLVAAGDKAEAAKADASALAPELRQLMPRAQSQQEVAAAIQPYAQFEHDFRQRGPQAVIDAMAQRGVHLADLSNPQHTAEIASRVLRRIARPGGRACRLRSAGTGCGACSRATTRELTIASGRRAADSDFDALRKDMARSSSREFNRETRARDTLRAGLRHRAT